MATKKTETAKTAVKEEVKKAAAKAEATTAKAKTAVKDAAVKADKEVKAAAEKTEKAVKSSAKKTKADVKEATQKVEKEVKSATKKAEKAVKKTAQKIATKEVYFEFGGKQINTAEVADKIEKEYDGKVKSLRIYIKAEDNAAYYVVNDKDLGKIEL